MCDFFSIYNKKQLPCTMPPKKAPIDKKQKSTTKRVGDDDPLNDMPLAQRRKELRKRRGPKQRTENKNAALNMLPLEIWREIMQRTENGGKTIDGLMQVVKSEELRKAARDGKALWLRLLPKLPVHLVNVNKYDGVVLCILTDSRRVKHAIAINRHENLPVTFFRSFVHKIISWQEKSTNAKNVTKISPGDLLRCLMQVREEVLRKFPNENMYHSKNEERNFVHLYPETTPEASAKFCIVRGIDYEDRVMPGAYSHYTYLRKSKVLHVLDRAIEVCRYFANKRFLGPVRETYESLLERMNDPKVPFV